MNIFMKFGMQDYRDSFYNDLFTYFKLANERISDQKLVLSKKVSFSYFVDV